MIPFPVRRGVRFAIVKSYPAYCVGDDGSVWSRLRNFTTHERIGELANVWKRRRTPTNGYYPRVSLYNTAGQREFRVHQLVLEAFVGRRPAGKEACHINGNREDNRLKNLRWGTARENAADRRRHGTLSRGETQGTSLLTESEVIEIRRRYAAGETSTSLAKEFGVGSGTVRGIAYGSTWKHVGGAAPASLPFHVRNIEFVANDLARLEGPALQMAAPKLEQMLRSTIEALRGRC